MRIILLDLNYTLVSNRNPSVPLWATLKNDSEEYRQWLVELIRPEYVVLVTARPKTYQIATLNSIIRKCGWFPQEDYFNQGLEPPRLKEQVLLKHILPRYQPDQCLAIESNPKTRAMYHRYQIRTCSVDPNSPWTILPTGDLTEFLEDIP
jgi:hypothetical protein